MSPHTTVPDWLPTATPAVQLYLPDGSSVLVATTNPVGAEHYVQAARAFAAWAFKTPAQRAREACVNSAMQCRAPAPTTTTYAQGGLPHVIS